MQIGELAKSAGVTVQTIRFYERKGLLPSPPRKESGYRIYDEADLRRLQFVRQAKRLGFSLDDIQSILRMRGRGACPCNEVIGIAERHLADAEQQIRHLQRFRDELSRTLAMWRRSKRPTVSGDAICTLIERTLDSNGGNKNGTAKRRSLPLSRSGLRR
jgi:DNA-binding transcriptional MerR regulator